MNELKPNVSYKPLKVSIKERNLVREFMGVTYSFMTTYIDWNILMPVVEKIERLDGGEHGSFGVHITSNTCNIQGSNLWKTLQGKSKFPVYMSDPNAILDSKIESTWYNVVEFIKFYNKQNQ